MHSEQPTNTQHGPCIQHVRTLTPSKTHLSPTATPVHSGIAVLPYNELLYRSRALCERGGVARRKNERERAGRTYPIHAYLLAKEEARRAAGGAMKQSEGTSPATRANSEAIFMAGCDELCVFVGKGEKKRCQTLAHIYSFHGAARQEERES